MTNLTPSELERLAYTTGNLPLSNALQASAIRDAMRPAVDVLQEEVKSLKLLVEELDQENGELWAKLHQLQIENAMLRSPALAGV